MKRKLIDKAKCLSFSIFQHPSSNKYLIQHTSTSKDVWLLEEQAPDEWLVSVNRVPEAILGTETVLGVLEKMI